MTIEIPEIVNLDKTVTYGYSLIQKVELKTKGRVRKLLLFLMMGATQSYSEAILKLLRPPNIYDKAAEVLFRSLIENLTNLNYIFTGKSESNAISFMLFSTEEQISYAKNCISTLRRFPEWNLDLGPVKGINGWNEFLLKKENEKERIVKNVKKLRGYEIPPMPKQLSRRAELADKLTTTLKIKQRTSSYGYYIQFYKYFSQSAHLTMPGLEQFLDKQSNKYTVDGKSEDAVRVAIVTHALYFSILKYFAKQFKLYDSNEFEKIKVKY